MVVDRTRNLLTEPLEVTELIFSTVNVGRVENLESLNTCCWVVHIDDVFNKAVTVFAHVTDNVPQILIKVCCLHKILNSILDLLCLSDDINHCPVKVSLSRVIGVDIDSGTNLRILVHLLVVVITTPTLVLDLREFSASPDHS